MVSLPPPPPPPPFDAAAAAAAAADAAEDKATGVAGSDHALTVPSCDVDTTTSLASESDRLNCHCARDDVTPPTLTPPFADAEAAAMKRATVAAAAATDVPEDDDNDLAT